MYLTKPKASTLFDTSSLILVFQTLLLFIENLFFLNNQESFSGYSLLIMVFPLVSIVLAFKDRHQEKSLVVNFVNTIVLILLYRYSNELFFLVLSFSFFCVLRHRPNIVTPLLSLITLTSVLFLHSLLSFSWGAGMVYTPPFVWYALGIMGFCLVPKFKSKEAIIEDAQFQARFLQIVKDFTQNNSSHKINLTGIVRFSDHAFFIHSKEENHFEQAASYRRLISTEFFSIKDLEVLKESVKNVQSQTSVLVEGLEIKDAFSKNQTVDVQLTKLGKDHCLMLVYTSTDANTSKDNFIHHGIKVDGVGRWELSLQNENLRLDRTGKDLLGIKNKEVYDYNDLFDVISEEDQSNFKAAVFNVINSHDKIDVVLNIDGNVSRTKVRLMGAPVIEDNVVVKLRGYIVDRSDSLERKDERPSIFREDISIKKKVNFKIEDDKVVAEEAFFQLLNKAEDKSIPLDEFYDCFNTEDITKLKNLIQGQNTATSYVQVRLNSADSELKVEVKLRSTSEKECNGSLSYIQMDTYATGLETKIERYSAAIETITEAFVVLGVAKRPGRTDDLTLLEYNSAAALLMPQITNLEKNSSIRDFVPYKLFEKLCEIYRSNTKFSKSLRCEFDFVSAEWLDISIVPVKDSISICFKDVSGQKEFDSKIRTQSERYVAAIEGGNDIFFILTPIFNRDKSIIDFQVLEVNSNFLRLTDQDEKKVVLGASLKSLKTILSYTVVNELFVNSWKESDNLSREIEVPFSDGSLRWMSFKIVRISGGLAITLSDIHDRKNAEKELLTLNRSLKNMKDVLDKSTLVSLISDEGKFIDVNKYFEEYTGWSQSELEGAMYDVFYDKEYVMSLLEIFKNAFATEGIWTGDMKGRSKGGRNIWLDSVVKYIYDEENDRNLYLAIQKDITGRKLIEEEREKFIEDLKLKNEGLSQFTYITSHNLRAPIASIKGLINIYYSNISNQMLKEEVVSKIKESADTLDNTFKDLNAILEIRKDINDAKEKVYLPEVLDNTLINLKEDIDPMRMNISSDFSSGEVVYAVRTYTESILTNLISNAIKYRDEERPLNIDIKTSQTEDYLLLSVADNGRGIDLKRYGDKLFRLYFKLQEQDDSKGIGLHLVKSQIETMGGKVEVESKPGKGTTFLIYFKRGYN